MFLPLRSKHLSIHFQNIHPINYLLEDAHFNSILINLKLQYYQNFGQ